MSKLINTSVVIGCLVLSSLASASPIPYRESSVGQLTECNDLGPKDPKNGPVSCELDPLNEKNMQATYDPVSKILTLNAPKSPVDIQAYVNGPATTRCFKSNESADGYSTLTSEPLSYCTPGAGKIYVLLTMDASVNSQQVVTSNATINSYMWALPVPTPVAENPALWVEIKISGIQFSPAS